MLDKLVPSFIFQIYKYGNIICLLHSEYYDMLKVFFFNGLGLFSCFYLSLPLAPSCVDIQIKKIGLIVNKMKKSTKFNLKHSLNIGSLFFFNI